MRIQHVCFPLCQAYTCVESTLVALSLLPRFVEFFGEGDVSAEDTVRLLSIFMAFSKHRTNYAQAKS